MDFLTQLENNFGTKPVGIAEFSESKKFCTPSESPIWMADLSSKPIGEICIGDRVMGWGWPDGMDVSNDELGRQNQALSSWKKRHLTTARVLAIHRKIDQVYKVTMERGRTVRCTS